MNEKNEHARTLTVPFKIVEVTCHLANEVHMVLEMPRMFEVR